MFESLRVGENRRAVRKIIAIGGALALVGCGGAMKKSEASSQAGGRPSAGTTSPLDKGVMITFDDLGGGSSIITVYPGVGNSTVDKTPNGTFDDGEAVSVLCKQEGRTVHSDPSVGEEKRSSNEWFRINGSPGLMQYATAVYVENPQAALQKLPDC